MSDKRNLFRKIYNRATDEELHPIIMSSAKQPSSVDDYSTVNVELKATAGTVQISPLPESSAPNLRDGHGGYLGPAAFDQNEEYNLPGQAVNNNNKPYQNSGGQSASQRGRTSITVNPNEENPSSDNILYRQWKNRTGLEQRLLVVTCSLAVVVIVVLIGVALVSNAVLQNPSSFNFFSGGADYQFCHTPECIVAAGEIIQWMDKSADPCENFIQYTCGGWKALHPIPDDKSRWDSFGILRERMNQRIRELLEIPVTENDTKAVKTAKVTYRACTNDTAWQNFGIRPLVEQMDTIHKWPLITPEWTEDGFDWVSSVLKLRKLGAHYFFNIYVSTDSFDSSTNIIKISAAQLPVRQLYLTTNDSRSRDMETRRIRILSKILYHHLNDGQDSENETTTTSNYEDLSDKNETENESDIISSTQTLTSTIPSNELNDSNSALLEDASNLLNFMEMGVKSKKKSHKKSSMKSSTSHSDFKKIQEQDANDLWEFWISIAKLMPTPEEATNSTRLNNPMTVDEFQNKTTSGTDKSEIDWLEFINSIFSDAGLKITGSERIIVEEPIYITKLLKLLQKTPKRVVANSILYQWIHDMGNEVTPAIAKALRENPDEDLSEFGRSYNRPWVDCSIKINALLDHVVTSLYIKKFFSVDAKIEAEAMVADIRDAFKRRLYTLDWMDESTRKHAIEKVDKMVPLVAYPESALNLEYLEEYYEGLPEASPTDHFGNMVKFQSFLSVQQLKKLRIPPKHDQWTSGSAVINAFYHLSKNAMMIPAGILQSPFYRPNTIKALNYGSIGAVIGHELTHGYDVRGSKRDADGNINNWWSNFSSASYEKKSQCFKDQYNGYDQNHEAFIQLPHVAQPVAVNGNITQSENIADNGGIRQSWMAYKKSVSESGENMRLYGLESISQDQLFFITFGQQWCSSFTEKGIETTLKFGGHAPGPIRVFGTIRNSKEFSEIFKCKKNTTVNPVSKCTLW